MTALTQICFSSFTLLLFLLSIRAEDNTKNDIKLKKIRKVLHERTRYLEQHVSNLRMERHRSTRFHFITLKTKISLAWESLPSRKDVKLSEVNGTELCPVYFHIDLMEMGRPNDLGVIDVCIMRENGSYIESQIFLPGTNIEYLDEKISPAKLLDGQFSVTGYVHAQPNSLATGYLDDGYFYGTVRLFDKWRRYHIHYYVEPISSASLYSERFFCQGQEIIAEPGENAILFEFIPHEDYLDPAAKAACNSSKVNKNPIQEPPKTIWNEEKQGARFMEENILHDDDDVVHVSKTSGGSNTQIFDLRFFDTFMCDICVWIQPHFAENFGLGGSLERGIAEAVHMLKFTNKIFRSLDFNGDGATENIGIQIREMVVTDEISAINPEGVEIKDNISRQINTTTPKIALQNMVASMKGRFKDCCITLGLIYHNMAPAIMGTSVGGICTPNHNYGIVSGYTHTHKIGIFDVYRGLMHTLGQLLGGTHDVVSEAYCYKNQEPRTEFRNEYPLHPIQLLNLGLRPKSLTFSPCSKDEITKFLTSKAPHCLQQVKEKPFCGNGVIEGGEECDCGSLRDCRLRHACCGESDSVLGCKIIIPGKKRCYRRSNA